MEGEKESTNLEDDKRISKFLPKFIGKNCSISFNNSIFIPVLNESVLHLNAILLGYDSEYIYTSFAIANKTKNGVVTKNILIYLI